MQLFEARMTCEECGNTGHTGVNALSWRRTWTTSTTTTNIVPQ
jgi:hypothetical protein